MIKALFCTLVMLSLGACQPGAVGVGSTPPAPLNQTTLDEKGLIAAFAGYDLALTAVDVLVATKELVPGSPKALQVQRLLIAARDALKVASAAQRAGSAATYEEALTNATAAFNQATVLLGRK